MKSLFAVIILGAIVYLAFRFGPSLIQGSYESIEYGVKFSYPSYLLTQEMSGNSTLEVRGSGTSSEAPHVFFQKYKHSDGQALSYRIPREFGEVMLNEKTVTHNGVSGISFNWQGYKGLESAFAFQVNDRDYVLSTYGLPNKDVQAWFDMIAGSLAVTYE